MLTTATIRDLARRVQYLFDLAAAPQRPYVLSVSLSQIRYFVAVAEEGHVGRAAERVHIAQPPLSRQIRALEDELGTPLFERTARGMRLLPKGLVFLEHARGILANLDAAVAAVANSANMAEPSPMPPPCATPKA